MPVRDHGQKHFQAVNRPLVFTVGKISDTRIEFYFRRFISGSGAHGAQEHCEDNSGPDHVFAFLLRLKNKPSQNEKYL
jgi:hypothetical protein